MPGRERGVDGRKRASGVVVRKWSDGYACVHRVLYAWDREGEGAAERPASPLQQSDALWSVEPVCAVLHACVHEPLLPIAQ